MAASRKVYYDKDGNKKVFIGNPKNAPRNYGKKKQLKPFSKKQFPETYIPGRDREKLKEKLKLKPGRTRGEPRDFIPKGQLKPPPPEYFKQKRKYSPRTKLALKGGGRAYGKNS